MINSDFDALRLSLASPEEIKSWSHGEILKPETINYRTFRPEKDGLFDERIFGPTRDYECYCGKYKRVRFKGVVCDKCGVEVTQSRVRRERMGHISLAGCVVHPWFFKRTPQVLPRLLDLNAKTLEGVIYFAEYLVTFVDENQKMKVLEELNEKFERKKEELAEETETRLNLLEKELKDEIRSLRNKVAGRRATRRQETRGSAPQGDQGGGGQGIQSEAIELRIESLEAKHRKEILFLREQEKEARGTLEESFKKVEKIILGLAPRTTLSEGASSQLQFWEADSFFRVGMGAEALREVLEDFDLDEEIKVLTQQLKSKSVAVRKKAILRLRTVQGIKEAQIDPVWMILAVLPVIPPDLRPMVQLPGGRFATSDLNDLYRKVINRSNRLKELISLGAPQIILQNEKRMLQEAVDSLIEGPRRPPRTGQRQLRSLSEYLKGKTGRFRQNLLGKRVDYSGRSVIVVGPELKIDQVGLPKEMALELFKPFVLRELILAGFAPNLKSAKNVLEQRGDEVWDILEKVTEGHPVLLNRAPTLHRHNIQAFYPVLIDGEAIAFHPAICSGFNADFDGDQMAVHVPLSRAAVHEAKSKMLSPLNFLKLADASPIVDLKNEVALGLFLLTTENPNARGTGLVFYDVDGVLSAYQHGELDLQAPVLTFIQKEEVKTTAGRLILNEALPEALKFHNRAVDRKGMRDLIARCFNECGVQETVKLVDTFKSLGGKYATLFGASFASFDFEVPPERTRILAEAQKGLEEIESNFRRGLLTERERHNQVVGLWQTATHEVAEIALSQIDPYSMVAMTLNSGSSKVNPETLRQVLAMRGLMVDSQGNIKETPIRTSAIEGSTAFEGFLSAIGGRKGLIDTALLTASAGYLTRRLVDVAHDVLIREVDCGTRKSLMIRKEEAVEGLPLKERVVGRIAGEDIQSSFRNGETIVRRNELITGDLADQILESGVVEVPIRSLLTCEALYGVCSMCYGQNMATRELVGVGEAVGVIAAQSIGEPGTQLTLRTFHAGGIATKEITQGLPRVEELFEARSPKVPGVLSELSGVVEISETDDAKIVKVIAEEKVNGKMVREERVYSVPPTVDLLAKSGDFVTAGDRLSTGQLDLKELLKLKGMLAVQEYLLKEIQTVYRSQGVTIDNKHIEIILRKMGEKVRVKSSGGTRFLPGESVYYATFESENRKAKEEAKAPAKGERVLLGITKTSLMTDSWLSAASFQSTDNVLTAASVNTQPQTDYLRGLKENVIIGRLVPTGERAKVKA